MRKGSMKLPERNTSLPIQSPVSPHFEFATWDTRVQLLSIIGTHSRGGKRGKKTKKQENNAINSCLILYINIHSSDFLTPIYFPYFPFFSLSFPFPLFFPSFFSFQPF